MNVAYGNGPQGVAVITGGGVRIGREISLRLAAAGYAVAIHARCRSAASDETAKLIERDGGRAAVVYGDLADADAVENLLPQVVDALGPPILLVNNASMFESDTLATLDRPLWDRHFAVNLAAPTFLAAAMAKSMPPSLIGSVINILDQRVWKPTPEYTSYTLTKAALWFATRTFAQALAPRIRVNAVGPGPSLPNTRQKPEDFARQVASVPLERRSHPRDIAEAVIYLAGAASVTGQMIAVDSGQHLSWKTPDAYGVDG